MTKFKGIFSRSDKAWEQILKINKGSKVVCIEDIEGGPIKGQVYNVVSVRAYTKEGHGSRLGPSGEIEYYGISDDIIDVKLSEFGEYDHFNVEYFICVEDFREERLADLGI